MILPPPVSCWMPGWNAALRLLILGQITFCSSQRRQGVSLPSILRCFHHSSHLDNFDKEKSRHPNQSTNISRYRHCCSVFGEDALVNVSVEKKEDNDGKLAGYIRIRSKTQGIALSLGDRITSVQRGLPEKQ